MGHKIKYSLVNSRIDFFYYTFRNILLVSLPLVVISALILSLPHSSATVSDLETDSLTLTLSTSCTLSSSVEEAHNASLNGGQYEEGIGITKVNAYCNDNNGYSIYAIGSSGDMDGNTDLISNINDNYNIHTGIYDSSSITASSPSSWSMKLTAGVGSGINTTPPTINNNYDNYSVVPENYTQVASRASKTDMTIDTSVTGSYFTTTYDIYASSLQPAGTYTGKVKYLMVHPQSNSQHFGFNEVFAANGKSAINVDGNSYYAMQDMTSDICSKVGLLNEASQTQLVDTRDNKLYWVAKLEDGHCWMTQNLDFGIKANATLNSQTTDLNVAYDSGTGQYAEYNDGYTESNGIIYYTPASTATTIDFTDTTVTGWQNSNTAPYTTNKTDSTETGHASLGNYYNWTAAIASNSSSSLTQDTLGDISKNPKNSICPKGWRLPTISNGSETLPGSTNEFARLNYLYNENKTNTDAGLVISPLWLKKSGYITNQTLSDYLVGGRYWSSTTLNTSNAYNLNFGNNSVSTNSSAIRQVGRPIRCIVR